MGRSNNQRYGFDELQYQNLRQRFHRMVQSGEPVLFRDVEDFLRWASSAGYDYGKKLDRFDRFGPWSPENCFFRSTQQCQQEYLEKERAAKRWEAFAAPIRERYREEIQRITAQSPSQQKPAEPEYFRYYHPDEKRRGKL